MDDHSATRASDEDRERALEILRDASVDGRLTMEELADRAERVHRARTLLEVDSVIADLSRPTDPTSVSSPLSPRNVVMTSAHESGRWHVPPRSAYRIVCATLKLVLREAILPPGDVEISLTVIGLIQLDCAGVHCSASPQLVRVAVMVA